MTSALAQGRAMATGGGLSELRSRLLFVLLAIVVYRIGSHIPVPGIDPERLALLFNQNQGGILDLVNMFGGGALERMSIFALGIMPYISASIIMQLLTVISPQLEQLKKEGEVVSRSCWSQQPLRCSSFAKKERRAARKSRSIRDTAH